jgi:glutathione peroxidase
VAAEGDALVNLRSTRTDRVRARERSTIRRNMITSSLALSALCLVPLACSSSTDSKSSMESGSHPASSPAPKAPPKAEGFYALSADDIDGHPRALAKYQGQVTLVVNVASQCGFTPQYEGLEKLYTELAPRGFTILAFPSNDFGGQEPGTPEEIKSFCSSKYDVTFPLFAKLVTKPGADQSPIYADLQRATGKVPNWNFCKYLIGKDGKVISFYPSKVTPQDADLRKAIDAALSAK